MKKSKKLGTVLVICFLVIISTVWFYARLRAPTYEQENQLKSLIRSHNVSKIRQLAYDKNTEEFLLSLSKYAKIQGSDFQGTYLYGNGYMIGYFPATIDGHDIQTYMIKANKFELIPKWRLYKISI